MRSRFRLRGGAEIMVHIGIDSMKLEDHEIETLIAIGQKSSPRPGFG